MSDWPVFRGNGTYSAQAQGHRGHQAVMPQTGMKEYLTISKAQEILLVPTKFLCHDAGNEDLCRTSLTKLNKSVPYAARRIARSSVVPLRCAVRLAATNNGSTD